LKFEQYLAGWGHGAYQGHRHRHLPPEPRGQHVRVDLMASATLALTDAQIAALDKASAPFA
jgi:hypothetical protein